MPIIIPANSASSGAFEVANSVMLNNPGDAATLSRSNSSGTSTKKGTISVWVKGGEEPSGNNQTTLASWGDANNHGALLWNGSDKIDAFDYQSGYASQLQTNAVLRDVASWYHIVYSWDTTLATANDRQKVYINGVEQTYSTRTNYSQDATTSWNANSYSVRVGSLNSSSYFRGYMSEVVFIDGTQYAASDFGEFEEDSGIWRPIKVSGLTFGTNGAYLDFQDSANLGNDVNGGTDFTETNLAATDQMIDTCTKNFPTLNPLEGYSANVGTNTYSQGNLQVLTPSSGNGNTLSTIGVSSGKWYSEFYIKASSGVQRALVGVSGDVGSTLLAGNNMGSLSGALDVGYMGNDGDKFVSGSESSYGGSAFSNGDVIGVALDLDNRTVNFAQNNSFKGTIAIASTGTWHMGCGDVSGGVAATIVANYGQNSSFAGSITAANNTDEYGEGLFKYAPPSGFITLNSKNLAEYGG